MKNNCTVYLHIFPDHKRYVGYTSRDLRRRWDGGLGYENQRTMFDAICKYGWNNVNHYILFENLNKHDASVIEAALIQKWKTYQKSYGYNSVIPEVDTSDFELPAVHKTKVDDVWDKDIKERIASRSKSRSNESGNAGGKHYGAVAVYCPEFDEVFYTIMEAAVSTGVCHSAIRNCLHGRQKTAGTHYYTGEPLHWEYVK